MSDKLTNVILVIIAMFVVLWFGVVEVPSMRFNYYKEVENTKRIYNEDWKKNFNEVAYLLRCDERNKH